MRLAFLGLRHEGVLHFVLHSWLGFERNWPVLGGFQNSQMPDLRSVAEVGVMGRRIHY